MLSKLNVLRGAFAQKDVHPLADPRELRRILDELPADNDLKALDEIVDWFESLRGEEMPADLLYEATRQLDEAAQTPLRKLSRDYLSTRHFLRADEKRLWTLCHGFHFQLANTYERCFLAVMQRTKGGDQLKGLFPLICARLIAALGGMMKWRQYRYGPFSKSAWQRLGRALLIAEERRVIHKSVQLYPFRPGMTSPHLEFVKVVAFQAASMDCLLPLQIELAERLMAHFLPGFTLTERAEADSVYWLDLESPQPPQRLVRMPKHAGRNLRFFKPAAAHARIEALRREVELGAEVPADINLGAQYPNRLVLPVLAHLAAYLAPVPPQRAHHRHNVKHRMAVASGFAHLLVIFSSGPEQDVARLRIESWVVENVSRGGFGVLMNGAAGEGVSVGALIAMQPEGGHNWLLGIVRRLHRDSDAEIRLGIQTLAQQVTAVGLTVRPATAYAAASEIQGLLLPQGSAAGEVRLVLPPAAFDLTQRFELAVGGGRQVLTPVALLEQTADYDMARFRVGAPG